MPNRHVLLAALVASGLSGVAGAATLNGTMDSSLFPYKYEGDVLPTAAAGLDFVRVGSAAVEADSASLGVDGSTNYLHINTDSNSTGSDLFGYKVNGGTLNNPGGDPDNTWNPDYPGPWTIEIRARVLASNSGTYGAIVQGSDGNTAGRMQLFDEKVKVESAEYLEAGGNGANADAFHVFRIASYMPDWAQTGPDQVVEYWRDGVYIGQTSDDTEFTTMLQFGDVLAGAEEVNFQVDYLRWTYQGAYAPPVPEPASLGLLVLGAGALLRRRK